MSKPIIFSIKFEDDSYFFYEDGTYFWNGAHDERWWKIEDGKLYWQGRLARREGRGFSRFFTEDGNFTYLCAEEQKIIDGISRALIQNLLEETA